MHCLQHGNNKALLTCANISRQAPSKAGMSCCLKDAVKLSCKGWTRACCSWLFRLASRAFLTCGLANCSGRASAIAVCKTGLSCCRSPLDSTATCAATKHQCQHRNTSPVLIRLLTSLSGEHEQMIDAARSLTRLAARSLTRLLACAGSRDSTPW